MGKNLWVIIKINSNRVLVIKVESFMFFSGLKIKRGKVRKFRVKILGVNEN